MFPLELDWVFLSMAWNKLGLSHQDDATLTIICTGNLHCNCKVYTNYCFKKPILQDNLCIAYPSVLPDIKFLDLGIFGHRILRSFMSRLMITPWTLEILAYIYRFMMCNKVTFPSSLIIPRWTLELLNWSLISTTNAHQDQPIHPSTYSHQPNLMSW